MSDQVNLLSLSDLHSDCDHLTELIGVITDQIQEMGIGEVIARPFLNRHAALLWIAEDLAKALRDNIERADDHHRQLAVEARTLRAECK